MESQRFKRFFGALLTIIGIVIVIFACIAFLSTGKPILGMTISKWETIVPFAVGLVFLLSGISLINNS